MPRKPVDIHNLVAELKSGNRFALSKAITIVESERESDEVLAMEILDRCLENPYKTARLGITGPPGVGKSGFIEQLGLKAIESGHRVAVLAIDPTSNITRGSILGDKTRMQKLSGHEMAYIRPSPSSGHLGGIAAKTRESIRLCEAAGYDFILVETVGVGQSEIAVKNITDCFVLLLQPGSGDELQGIKRGIMELADIAVINKADGAQLDLAKRAKKDFGRALHLLATSDSPWTTEVILHSNLVPERVDSTWTILSKFFDAVRQSGWLKENRMHQQMVWFEELLKEQIIRSFFRNNAIQEKIEHLREHVRQQKMHPYRAIQEIFKPNGD